MYHQSVMWESDDAPTVLWCVQGWHRPLNVRETCSVQISTGLGGFLGHCVLLSV